MFTSLRYPSAKQNWIWSQRRRNIKPSDIADELNVSRPFISKEQRIAENRIKKLLHHAASINRITIHKLSPRYGIATGYCSASQTDTYILYSPIIGLQIWFAHKGNCAGCSDYPKCEATLTTLAKEWDIQVSPNLAPTDLAINLFETIIRRLKWHDTKTRGGK
jgi:hypothetical protein